MTWLILPAFFILASPLGVVVLVRFSSQRKSDRDRKTYLLTFPTDLTEAQVTAWLRSISGSLRTGMLGRLVSVPTITLETWATDKGIAHRLQVPWQRSEYISRQLRLAGINVEEDNKRPRPKWTLAVELGMKRPSRTLNIPNKADLATSLLASIDTLKPDEIVVIQWVVSPAPPERPPARDTHSKSNDFTLKAVYQGTQSAHHDEIEDRRRKLEEPNFQAIARIGTTANTQPRAASLISRVLDSLRATSSNYNYFEPGSTNVSKLIGRINEAASPFFFPAQVSISELAGLISWPLGEPMIAGLPHGPARQLYATEDVPRVGRLMGASNYSGHERDIAMSYRWAVEHVYVSGRTGVGKSSLMGCWTAQDMDKGYGVVVIDVSNSDSHETLYSRALNYIPEHRLDDVIIIDVNRSRKNPVGFNILDQGNPGAVVDQLTELFTHIYQDTSGIWTKKLLFYGLYTLAERPGMTFVDLIPLLVPEGADEETWAQELKKNVTNPSLRKFWKRWANFSQQERDRYTQPLYNRIWQLADRPEIHNIIGQSESSFKMADVLSGNKILLVSLAGLPKDTAGLIATMLTQALWREAQAMTPEKANFLYLDEFQLMTDLPVGLDDMMDRARKHKLGLVLATQHLKDKKTELKSAVINNALTRVIFQSGADEARMWMNEFGRQYISENDIAHLRKYEAVAQIATDSGTGAPVTLKAMAPLPPTGMAKRAIDMSAAKYGRNLADVDAQVITRRKGTPTHKSKRAPIGERKWKQ